jgi:hypothetical protein
MRAIKEIDKDHNGYVTSTEIDDILKINYASKLKMANLKPIIKPFCSISNPVLIDYKGFRDYILNGINQLKFKELQEKKNRENTLSNLLTAGANSRQQKTERRNI